MNKNVASQKITLLAIDTSTNAPKTGDAANLTAYVSKDDGAVTVLADTSAAEKDATNAPGLYDFDVAQAETNADKLVFSGKSGTANVKLVPVTVYTRPANASALSVNASGHVTLADASLVTAKLGTFALAKTTNITGFNDIAATAIVSSGAITTSAGAVTNVTNVSQVTGNVLGDVDGSVGAVGTGGINANSFTAGALNAAALATDAVNEIAAAILVTPANKIATDTEGRVSVESNDVQMDEDGYLLVKRHDGTEIPTVVQIAAGVSSGSGSDIAQDVWEYASRTLTQGPVVTYPGQAHDQRELVKGKAYLNANNRAWTFTMPAGADWPTDLTGGTVTLTLAPSSKLVAETPAAVGFTLTTGTVTQATGSSRAVRFDLPAASTVLLSPGEYDFEVEWKTGATDKAALVLGTVMVMANEV
jgi:hypothetical protein